MNNLIGLVFSFLLIACMQFPPPGQHSENITQGLKGKIEIREGDFMPGPDRFPASNPTPKTPAARREIYIYEATPLNQAKANGVFYSDIRTKLIAKVFSDKAGTFQVSLKPGKYSLFSKEPQGLYANSLDGEGYIFLVEVKPNQVTPVAFIIDYNASY